MKPATLWRSAPKRIGDWVIQSTQWSDETQPMWHAFPPENTDEGLAYWGAVAQNTDRTELLFAMGLPLTA